MVRPFRKARVENASSPSGRVGWMRGLDFKGRIRLRPLRWDAIETGSAGVDTRPRCGAGTATRSRKL